MPQRQRAGGGQQATGVVPEQRRIALELGLGEADLYISHHRNGQWQQPVALAHGINTKRYEYCPYLTPDGKFLFFSSEYQVKWISADVLKR